MTISVLLLCFLMCASVVLWFKRKSRTHVLPPSCFGEIPVIGHVHLLLVDTSKVWHSVKAVAEDSVRKGGVTHFRIITDIYYIITDPDDALTIANTCLQKLFIYDFGKSWLGDGLITGSGPIWQRHRKLLNPVFSLPVIHGFLEVFNSQSRQLLKEMEPRVGKEPFDHLPLIRKLILRITCLTTFGETGLKDKEINSKYMKTVDAILHTLTQRIRMVWLHSETIYKWFGYRRKQDKLEETLDVMSNEVIQRKRAVLLNQTNFEDDKSYTSTGLSYKPILDRILQSSDNLMNKEIKNEIDTTIVAGFETSSNLIACAMVLIGSYPEVQERMYEEIVKVLGEDKHVEKEDLQKLVYTDAVIKEALRVLPTAPVVGRYIHKEVKLKNYTLPADSHCILLPIGLHRHPSWGADADQFRPERWLEPETLPTNSNAFAAFGLGKRSCIGRTYAMTSVKVVLSHLIRKYRVAADHRKMEFRVDITLKPITGHEISLQHRNYQ